MELVSPYVTKPHPTTGVTNGKLGIWLFLGSEIMLFGALFSAYILLRTGASSWPDSHQVLNVKLAFVNTLVLIGSSVTVVMAWAALALYHDLKKYRLWMFGTLLLALAFLGIKAYEYGHKFHEHHFPSTSNFYGIYFTLTGLHGLHVLGGIAVFLFLLGPGAKMWKTNPAQFTGRVEATGLYWHFVDLVWIFLFPSIYLL